MQFNHLTTQKMALHKYGVSQNFVSDYSVSNNHYEHISLVMLAN